MISYIQTWEYYILPSFKFLHWIAAVHHLLSERFKLGLHYVWRVCFLACCVMAAVVQSFGELDVVELDDVFIFADGSAWKARCSWGLLFCLYFSQECSWVANSILHVWCYGWEVPVHLIRIIVEVLPHQRLVLLLLIGEVLLAILIVVIKR